MYVRSPAGYRPSGSWSWAPRSDYVRRAVGARVQTSPKDEMRVHRRLGALWVVTVRSAPGPVRIHISDLALMRHQVTRAACCPNTYPLPSPASQTPKPPPTWEFTRSNGASTYGVHDARRPRSAHPSGWYLVATPLTSHRNQGRRRAETPSNRGLRVVGATGFEPVTFCRVKAEHCSAEPLVTDKSPPLAGLSFLVHSHRFAASGKGSRTKRAPKQVSRRATFGL